jgi:hypothetical protein
VQCLGCQDLHFNFQLTFTPMGNFANVKNVFVPYVVWTFATSQSQTVQHLPNPSSEASPDFFWYFGFFSFFWVLAFYPFARSGGSSNLSAASLSHCWHCTALHCTALHCTALHCTALHCTALHCTALHCTALHCTTTAYFPLNFLCSPRSHRRPRLAHL